MNIFKNNDNKIFIALLQPWDIYHNGLLSAHQDGRNIQKIIQKIRTISN